MLKNVLLVSGSVVVTLFVVSVSTMFVYEAQARTNV